MNKIAPYEITNNGILLSTDPARLDPDAIAGLLSRSYWANQRPKEMIVRSLENSLVFGLYEGTKQVGLARVVTDYATFAWLCDVFIHEDYRGRGLGQWLVKSLIAHPQLQGLRRWMLATNDAHSLYAKYGFTELHNHEQWMEIFNG